MKMFPAYQKANRLARKHGRALVVTLDPTPHATADHWEAVTVDEWHKPPHKREIPFKLHFFDVVEDAQ